MPKDAPLISQVVLAPPVDTLSKGSGRRAPALRKPALPALTGLRTLLALNILFFHFTPPHPDFLTPLFNTAYVFVGFFFLISGFVLAYNYADRPRLDLRAFLVARVSRVYPTYLLALLLSVPFLRQEWTAHTPNEFYVGLLLTPLGLQSWWPPLATFWNTVGWTVPAEFFLYLAFPVLLWLMARYADWLRSPIRVVAAIALIWLIGLVPHTTYLLLNPDHLPGPADRYTYAFWLRLLKYSPPAYLWTFTAGVLLARLHGLLRVSASVRTAMALSALAGLGLFFAFGSAHVPYVLVHGCLLLPLFALLLLGLAGENAAASVFAWRPLVKVGETTFSLYLVHFNGFLLIHFYHLPERFHVEQLDPWISYVAIMALAFAILRLFEGPARNFVLRRFA